MKTETQITTTNTQLAINEEQIAQYKLIKETVCKGASDTELKMFMHQANRLGLDPLSKQVYAVKRWNSKLNREEMTIQTGIDGFRIIAQRSGEYAGQEGPFFCGEDGVWKDVWLDKKAPSASKVGIYRKGFTAPVYGVCLYTEFVQKSKSGDPTQFWAKMPSVMLSKCAESIALRKAFPAELSGIYTTEEMGQADNENNEYTRKACLNITSSLKVLEDISKVNYVDEIKKKMKNSDIDNLHPKLNEYFQNKGAIKVYESWEQMQEKFLIKFYNEFDKYANEANDLRASLLPPPKPQIEDVVIFEKEVIKNNVLSKEELADVMF